MEQIFKLIEATRTDNKNAQKNVEELISIGMPAIPDVINAIKENAAVNERLYDVLLQVHHPDIVPVLINLLQEENTDLSTIAFQALGQSQDQKALQPLLESLKSPRKLMAIDAIGELGNTQAIDSLLELADSFLSNQNVSKAIEGKLEIEEEEDFDDSVLLLLARLIIALAKLGNEEIAPIAILLTQYRSNDIYSDAEIIRKNAVKALQYVVLPGIFTALQRSLNDDYNEVRLEAIDAIFYLGIKEAIAELIKLIKDPNTIVFNNIIVRLYDLTGIRFENNIKVNELQEWWHENQHQYEKKTCYRLGKPIHLPDIIALLDKLNQRKPVLQELKIITGMDFAAMTSFSHDGNELVRSVRQWWEKEGDRFEDGYLYKYGRKQNLQSIV